MNRFLNVILLVLFGLLSACSPGSQATVPGTDLIAVQSAESVEQEEIKKVSLQLFDAEEYDALEEFAQDYRENKACYSNGIWKLGLIYSGLEPSREAVDAIWEARIESIQKWILNSPESITPRVLLARVWSSYAWKARGSDFIDLVAPESRALFATRLQEALKVLQQCEKIEERCPLYWSSLQQVALGLGAKRKEYDALFAQATHEFPDYHYYYTQRAWYLLPRWYGEEGEFLDDLTKKCDALGGSQGDIIYSRTMWLLNGFGSASRDIDQIFKVNKGPWERVDRGLEGIMQDFPESPAPISIRACFSAVAGARQVAVDSFKQLGGEVDLAHWNSEAELQAIYSWTFKK